MIAPVSDQPKQENDPRMTARLIRTAGAAGAAVTALLVALAMPAAGPAQAAGPATAHPNVERACGDAHAGQARYFALVRTDVHGVLGVHGGLGVRGPAARLRVGSAAAQTALPDGYGPADLRAAYHLSSTGGENQTIAVIDAYDDPTAEADLAVYRATYGLPPCTTDNGCFRKVNQRRQASPLPQSGAPTGWTVETVLDLDMASAACPQCRILLVEGDGSTGNCDGDYLCTAMPGYDAPTGNGTPNGLSAF